MNVISRFKGLRLSGILVFTGLFSMLIFNACDEDPSFIGRNLLPPSDDLETYYSEDVSIETDVKEGQPIITSVGPVLLLGSYSDPAFGTSRADFMTKFAIADPDIPSNMTVDSMILNLSLANYFGDSSTVMNLRIHPLTESLSNDTLQYSNSLPDGKFNPQALAITQVQPTDSLVRVKIVNPTFFQAFEIVDDSVYADPTDFYNFFKGFYVTYDVTEGEGAIIYFNLASGLTGLSMYFTDNSTGDQEVAQMVITDFTPRVNTFYHDYAGSEVEQYMSDEPDEDTAVFVSAMGGINTRIRFPGIEEWISKRPVAINKAELYLPVSDTLLNGLTREDFPEALLLQAVEDEGNFSFLYDYLVDGDNKTYFGGKFDPAEYAYVFNIGIHFQAYIEGEIENLDMVLRTSQSPYTANRVILNGPDSADKKMKLKIIYTEF